MPILLYKPRAAARDILNSKLEFASLFSARHAHGRMFYYRKVRCLHTHNELLNSYNWRQSVTALKEELKWELLQTRRKCLRLKLLHAIHYELSGIDKGTYLLEPHFISQRRDHSRKIRPFSSKTDIFKHSFFPSTIQSWNELPEELVLEKNNSNIFQALLGL